MNMIIISRRNIFDMICIKSRQCVPGVLVMGSKRSFSWMSASLIGHLGQALSDYHHGSVDISRAALLFGIGTEAFHHGVRGGSGTIFGRPCGGLTPVGPSGHTISLHPSSREDIIPPPGGFEFSPIALILYAFMRDLPGPAELGAVNPYAVHDHGQSPPSATMAFFMPRCLAIFIARP